MDENTRQLGHEPLSRSEVDDYKAIRLAFSDFGRFEDSDSAARAEGKRRFIEGIDYTPSYIYPKLRFFKDDATLVDKKSEVYNATLELESARRAAEAIGDEARAAELLLYRQFQDIRLQKVMLVDAASRLHESQSSSAVEVAKETFMHMNEEVYGEFNNEWYLALLKGEAEFIQTFDPKDEVSERITVELKKLLEHIGVNNGEVAELLNDKEMDILHSAIERRYGYILEAVPDTDDTVYYDAEECARIISLALQAGELADKGWSSVVNSAKSNPVTNVNAKKIFLPSSTRRNASELRRLIIHEQEVHARRGENGLNSGSELLKSGTASYSDAEEGLGVLFECAVAGNFDNASYNRAKERYIVAGLAIGSESGYPRDAREVFEIIWRMVAVRESKDGTMPDNIVESAKNKAFAHIENAFRGTDFWMKGVIYTKLKVYYEGLLANVQYVRENIDTIDEAIDNAMIGKYNHTDPVESKLIKTIINSK